MPVKEIGDPRLQALFGAADPRDGGVRPTVRLPGKGLPPVTLAALAFFAALLLFIALNERRTRQAEPAVAGRMPDGEQSAWASPPPLYVPPVQQPGDVPARPAGQQPAAMPVPPAVPVAAPAPRAAPQPAPVPVQLVQAAPAPPTLPSERTSSGAPLVIDTSGSADSATHPGLARSNALGSAAAPAVVRMRASALANRSMTVPQGYLIPAVLETGFDSTKPGFARAVVSRDVRGFDGKNVLIPRGSRLIGEYQSSIAPGQKRATINWIRLIRPDGMTIEMQAPAVDPEGRGGVPASVNTHFFAKLGDALLQSTFALGQAFAGRAVTGPVVVLPGAVASTASPIAPSATNYTPTLKVAPGKSISVFVAQDLDFSSAGAAR